MTNVSKYQMGLKLIPIIMLHLTSNIKSSRQLLKETTTILVLTDSIESNTLSMIKGIIFVRLLIVKPKNSEKLKNMYTPNQI